MQMLPKSWSFWVKGEGGKGSQLHVPRTSVDPLILSVRKVSRVPGIRPQALAGMHLSLVPGITRVAH